MIGKIFITRTGYDPQLGRHIKDPYLGDVPSIGACRTDFRKQLKPGDHLFVISGKVPEANQLVIGGFEVDRKMPAIDAYHEFPDQRLRRREDGQLTGNIILDADGNQHSLDDHGNFDNRIKNYIVGRNPIVLESDDEIDRGRRETLEALQEILKKRGKSPIELVTRFGKQISENQVIQLRDWLSSLKESR